MHRTLTIGLLMMAAQLAHADAGAKVAQGIQARSATQAFSNKAAAQLRKIDEHARFGRVLKSDLSNSQYVDLNGTLDGRNVSRSVRVRQGATGGSASYMISRGGTWNSRSVFRKVQPLLGHAEGDALESVRLVDREDLADTRAPTRDLRKVFLVSDGRRGRQLGADELDKLSASDRKALFHSGFNVGER